MCSSLKQNNKNKSSSNGKFYFHSWGLDIISKEKHKKFIIFSDSLSVLLSLNNKKLEHPLIIKLLFKLKSTLNKEIIFCWIPSHIGVRGNHRADAAAKLALDLTPDKYNIPYTDLKPKINNFLHKKWQQCWNRKTNNKLFKVKPFLGEWCPAFWKSRKEQVTITRLRIGHSRLTHSFILKQELQPQCSTCQMPCTSNMFSLSVKFLITPESTISMQILWRTYLRMSTWIMFCRSWKRPGCTRKYRLGYNPENTTNQLKANYCWIEIPLCLC